MSDLRKDLVSGDWIIMAPGRSGRPSDFSRKKIKRQRALKTDCPFEDLIGSENWPPIAAYPNEKNWKVVFVPNKYPALVHYHEKICSQLFHRGPYEMASGVGHHDLLITRDHDKNFPRLGPKQGFLVFKALQKRLQKLKQDRCLSYTSIFHAWGPAAGASIYHPHYQILSLPIVPPDIQHSLTGSQNFFKKHRKCVHCVMLDYEKKEKKRIIFENRRAIAVVPFVSRQPFEVRVFPKTHQAFLEKTPDLTIKAVVEALSQSLNKIQKYLGDPDYNFFIHTAPFKNQKHYSRYHWHIEILPKLTLIGGFEWSTGVEINVVDPDRAASMLNGK